MIEIILFVIMTICVIGMAIESFDDPLGDKFWKGIREDLRNKK